MNVNFLFHGERRALEFVTSMNYLRVKINKPQKPNEHYVLPILYLFCYKPDNNSRLLRYISCQHIIIWELASIIHVLQRFLSFLRYISCQHIIIWEFASIIHVLQRFLSFFLNWEFFQLEIGTFYYCMIMHIAETDAPN